MNTQIEKMLAAARDRRRQAREQATNLPWTIPVFAVSFAIGKLSRLVGLYDGMIRLVDIPVADMAEELRESAHYLLQAADLLEENPSSQNRRNRHERA